MLKGKSIPILYEVLQISYEAGISQGEDFLYNDLILSDGVIQILMGMGVGLGEARGSKSVGVEPRSRSNDPVALKLTFSFSICFYLYEREGGEKLKS